MNDAEKSKIIIDEDWKSQVEQEREQMEKQREEGPPEGDLGEIPPASFPMLVTSIATQAMIALGQIPDPVTQKAIYHPDLARHHIDTLSVLQEKTVGNLTAEESQMIEELLDHLRRLFLAAQTSMKMPPSPGQGG